MTAKLQTAVTAWSTRLLAALLAGDLFFVVAHFLLVFSPLLSNNNFLLDMEAGFGEWFQYLKFSGMIGLLAVLFRQQRDRLYLFWLVLASYLLLDDALQIHEKGGLWLAEMAGLPALLGSRPRDLGELGVSVFAGLLLLNLLVWTYRSARPQVRAFTQWLLLALLALVFFGVGVDMFQAMTLNVVRPYPVLRELLVVIEDGGEMVSASLMVWLVYRQTERVAGWSADQVGDWLREAVVGLVMLGVVTAVFTTIQFSTPALVGNDGYYHAKMGLLLREEGLDARPQLPLTILSEERFYNHHMLYHAYLALFARTDPAFDGGLALTQQVKNATIILAVLPFLAVWWLLRGQGVRWPVFWTLLLLVLSEGFLYRLSMPRAQSASLLLLVVALHWLLHGRYRWLLPLGMVYVWLYDAFPLLLLLGGVYAMAVFLTERRLVWPALAYPAAGIGLGLVVNPFFPQNITFIGHHLLAKLWDSDAIRVGIEWYPYNWLGLAQNAGPALFLFLVTLLLLRWRGQRLDARILTLGLLTVVFALMLFRARRFIEYFPAFALIFTAVGFSAANIESELGQRVLVQWRKWLPMAPVLLLLGLALFTLPAARDGVAYSEPADRHAAASLWLKAYGEPDAMIFQTDWDDFTRLFFYNSEPRYLVGLDPTFMARHDRELFTEWVQITRGEIATPGAIISQRFGADYVFADRGHEAFLREAAVDPYLHELYRDQYAVIFAVVAPAQSSVD